MDNGQYVILDLFAGTGSATRAFEDRGFTVIRVELDPSHAAEHHRDVVTVTPEEVREWAGGKWIPFVWASPPCTAFSVASIGRHWALQRGVYLPKSDAARDAVKLIDATLRLIGALEPRYWLLENPRGMLRKMDTMQGLPIRTITYCKYGERRMKPTDLFGYGPRYWTPRRPCKAGDPCHDAAPRGARTGTQGIKGARDRARIPYDLGLELADALAFELDDLQRGHR